MTYNIVINEDQRKALIELIKANPQLRQDCPPPGEEYPPFMYWIDMLEGLPEVESENPGILHGFCL